MIFYQKHGHLVGVVIIPELWPRLLLVSKQRGSFYKAVLKTNLTLIWDE